MQNPMHHLSAWMVYFDTRHEPAATIAANLSAHIFPADTPRNPLATVRQYLDAHGYPPQWALSARSALDFIGERNRREEMPPREYRALVYLAHDDDDQLDGARWLTFCERDDFHVHISRAAARRVFGTVLHDAGDIDFALLNRLCSDYGCGCVDSDFLVIRDDPGLPGIGDIHYLLRHLDMNPGNYEDVIYALEDTDTEWLYARHRDSIVRFANVRKVGVMDKTGAKKRRSPYAVRLSGVESL